MKVHRGHCSHPVLILVHGLGMTEKTWTFPYQERMGRGRIPYDYLLVDLEHAPRFRWNTWPSGLTTSTPWRHLPHRPKPLWEELAQRGYNLLTWSQGDPSGPISSAVDELRRVREEGRGIFGQTKVIFLCHSRGGLVVRQYLRLYEEGKEGVAAIVFLATPHHGSRVADLVETMGKLVISVERLLPGAGRGAARTIYAKWADTFRTGGVEELRPHSSLIMELEEWEQRERELGIRYVNLLGVSTRFNKIYRVTGSEPFEVREIFSLLDYLPRLVSPSLLPDEWVDGRGDGLVAGVRGRLHWIPSHDQKEFPVNHASVLIDPRVRELILERLEELR